MKSTTLSLSLLFALLLMLFTVVAVSASDDTGMAVYKKSCAACHDSGVLDAPKLRDKAVWAELNAEGEDDLTKSAINGIGKMPPKGGNSKLSDHEVKEAVEYMMKMGE
jgi:cytochrome c5